MQVFFFELSHTKAPKEYKITLFQVHPLQRWPVVFPRTRLQLHLLSPYDVLNTLPYLRCGKLPPPTFERHSFASHWLLQDQQVASVNFPICERPQCISSYQVVRRVFVCVYLLSGPKEYSHQQETPCGAIVSFLHNQPLVVDFLLSALYVAAESSKNSTYIKGYNRGGVALPEEAKKTRRSAGYRKRVDERGTRVQCAQSSSSEYRTAKVHFEPFPDLEELYREDGSQVSPHCCSGNQVRTPISGCTGALSCSRRNSKC
jgi:hypothetical protein